jgi:hypothetical protein
MLVRHPALAKHHRQRLRVDRWLETRIGQDRLQLGCEQKRAISERNIQRLFAHAIANEM